ncbi:MAG TPA: segregation/condensation protein A [Polyangia bacterium]|nr:segregation/condensation protein A [Polyangia bacterium]
MGLVSDDELSYQVALPEFEGPLDLLLHLVKKHELQIVDIPIAFITDQYLKMLDVMRSLNLDVAGEYLLMAATLCHLKSRELVPPDPNEVLEEAGDDEEGLDPRQELIRRLLEYQKYKEAAAQLGGRPVMGRNVWPRGASAEDVAGVHVLPGGAPLAEVPVFRLIESLERVLSKAKISFTHDVLVERISITDAINQLVDRLEREGTFTFESCFEFVTGGGALGTVKYQVVVTLLAILEMTRLKLVRLAQPEERGEIYVTRAAEDLKERAATIAQKSDEEYK